VYTPLVHSPRVSLLPKKEGEESAPSLRGGGATLPPHCDISLF